MGLFTDISVVVGACSAPKPRRKTAAIPAASSAADGCGCGETLSKIIMRFADVSPVHSLSESAYGALLGKAMNSDVSACSPLRSPAGTSGVDAVDPHPWIRGDSTHPPRAVFCNPASVNRQLASCKFRFSRSLLPFCPPEVKATWRAVSVTQ